MSNKKGNPAGRAIMLLSVLGVIVIFILVVRGTSILSGSMPFILLILIEVAATIYSGMTTSLLYKFYELKAPWYSFIPFAGELILMDIKYLKVGRAFYIIAVIFLGISQLPYSVLKLIGETGAISLPFYAMLVAFVALLIIQIVKGIGLFDTIKSISDEWRKKMHTSAGIVTKLQVLSFIPFVRVIAIYSLNKMLSTMVTFNNITIGDTDEVELYEVNTKERGSK